MFKTPKDFFMKRTIHKDCTSATQIENNLNLKDTTDTVVF